VDDLVSIAWVENAYEAAIVEAMLKEHGIPSMQKQVGIDGAMLGYSVLTGGGSRRVMVHAHRAEEARVLLEEARAEDERTVPEPLNARYLDEAQGRGPRNYSLIGAYARALLLAVVVFAIVFGIFMFFRAF
jgi:Putative prokaryotic signal transducing protein